MITYFLDGTPVPMLSYYICKGETKRVDDMTREELIEALRQLGLQLETMRRNHSAYRDLIDMREERRGP